MRVHPIITKGGDVVNTVPADVRMESYVRAGNVAAMKSANATMNRAMQGAAFSCDAQLAAIVPAKLMAMTLFDLCENDAQAARNIIAAFPRKSATEFRAIWQAILQPVTDV